MEKFVKHNLGESQLDHSLGRVRQIFIVDGQASEFKEAINYLAEGVDDVRHHHSISYDREARVGHKSAETSFIGYKTHIAMTPERIITAARVTSGEKGDGPMLPGLINKTELAGVVVDTVVGDAAYSSKDNLSMAKENGVQIVAKLNGMITQGHMNVQNDFDSSFEYNKDADRYICPAGVMSTRGSETTDKGKPNKSHRVRHR